MLGICRRYVRDWMEAEDVLSKGFFKVFTKIKQYQFQGSFEGWIRKIMVNESLMHLRKRTDFNLTLESSNLQLSADQQTDDLVNANSILELLNKLPTGYRTIFNLYVIEGYKHHEIAHQLDISINTSKSQLIKARKRLQLLINDSKIKTG
ncbi:MAG: sigma-70 family RNA polymerase sigma factor [Bacteroidetes bacterium]|nr:sigma-70 family RNA polymerase sigma factor [Bacteroidota bacterium]